MAENYSTFQNIEGIGKVEIADSVVAIIAGIAATEAEGVASLVGNITNEIVSTLGIKNLSKGVNIEMLDDTVIVTVTLNLYYGHSVPTVSKVVQDKVSQAIETMTGLRVAEVNVVIADVTIKK